MNKRFLHKRVIIACTLILLDARAMRSRNTCAFFKTRRVLFISIRLYKPRFRACHFIVQITEYNINDRLIVNFFFFLERHNKDISSSQSLMISFNSDGIEVSGRE